jgi:hypothetical protein
MTLPLTILASQKFANLLLANNALQQQITALGEAAHLAVPAINTDQIVLSSASADIGDRNVQLAYPRACLYSTAIKNTLFEKFRSLSGTVTVTTEVWASGNLVTDTDVWIHFYVEAITDIYRRNVGDMSDGFYFSGAYDVQFQAPKAGGLGFAQSAKVTCVVNVSQS